MPDRDAPKINFPWWAFLSQPIGHPTAKFIINPWQFKREYRVWLLEVCLRQETEVSSFLN